MEIAIGEKCFKLGLCVIFRCTWYWAYIMLVLFHDISHTELTPTRYWMQGKTLLTTSSKDFWDGNKGSHWNPKQFIIEITPSRVSHYNQSCKHAQSWILIQVTISMGKLMTSRSLRSAPFTKQVCSSLKYIPNMYLIVNHRIAAAKFQKKTVEGAPTPESWYKVISQCLHPPQKKQQELS